MLSRRQQWIAILVLCFTLFVAMLEAASIGVVYPLVNLLLEPEIPSDGRTADLAAALGVTSGMELVLYMTVLVIALFLAKSFATVGLAFAHSSFAHRLRAAWATEILESMLSRPYHEMTADNPSELAKVIWQDTFQMGFFIRNGMRLLAEVCLAATITAVLLFVSPIATLVTMVFVGAVGGAFLAVLYPRIARWGERQKKASGRAFMWIAQALRSIKESTVHGTRGAYLERFGASIDEFATLTVLSQTTESAPRALLETTGVLALVGMGAVMVWTGASQEAVATIALLAAAAFRIIPSLHRILSMWSRVAYYASAVGDVGQILERARNEGHRLPQAPADPFDRLDTTLELDDVRFAYPGTNTDVLQGASLTIRRGSVGALVGRSGAGKTTLVDVLLGLLTPSQGVIRLDGIDVTHDAERWRGLIGYVPQMPAFVDGSICDNIALSESVDEPRLWRALERAQLAEFVRDELGGIHTPLGDDGARLSGGQRQRLGIARALYREPRILVLDEATSALDMETERDLMKALQNLRNDITILMIAHRLHALQGCDSIAVLSRGRVVETGTFDDLANADTHFRELLRESE